MENPDSKILKNYKLDIDISKDYRKLSRKKAWVVLWVFIAMLICAFINLCIGSSSANIFEIISEAACDPGSQASIILFDLRLPHVICSLIAGASLGICGCILQSSLGNPLASPSTIGISQGAACGACIVIVFFGSLLSESQNITLIIMAFIFSLMPTLIIFTLSKLKTFNATSIVLCGLALSIFFGGLVALIQYFADSSKVAEVLFWTFGSVNNCDSTMLVIMGIIFFIVLVYSQINSMNLNTLECGDTTAHSLGLNVMNSRLLHMLVAAFCAGCITAFCGTINFIGLIAPHMMRRFCGSNYKYLIPCSALCGAIILSLSDILSASIIPGLILPIGAITSFIGAPIFIYVLMRKNKQI